MVQPQVFREQLELKVPARRMYATLKDVHNLIPKIVPDFIRSYEIVEGDGGAGTIRKITFGPLVSAEVTTAIEKVLEVNEEAMSVKYEVLDGELKKVYKSFVATTSYEEGKEGGGCVGVWTVEYEAADDAAAAVGSVPPPTAAWEAISGCMKAAEAFLLATPDYA